MSSLYIYLTDSVEEIVDNFMKQVGGFIDGAIDFTGLASVQEKIFALLNVVC